jgi:hypothetical protein
MYNAVIKEWILMKNIILFVAIISLMLISCKQSQERGIPSKWKGVANVRHHSIQINRSILGKWKGVVSYNGDIFQKEAIEFRENGKCIIETYSLQYSCSLAKDPPELTVSFPGGTRGSYGIIKFISDDIIYWCYDDLPHERPKKYGPKGSYLVRDNTAYEANVNKIKTGAVKY